MRSEIQQLEQIANKTAQQKQELQAKKAELAELEKQNINTQQSAKPTNYWPWIIGGGLLITGIIIAWLVMRSRKE